MAKKRKGVKGYVTSKSKATAKYVKGVKEAKSDYKDGVRAGLDNWKLWWNYTLGMLIANAGEWVDKEGLDKWEAVKNNIKLASQDYRKAQLGLVAIKHAREIETSRKIIEEALAVLGV